MYKIVTFFFRIYNICSIIISNLIPYIENNNEIRLQNIFDINLLVLHTHTYIYILIFYFLEPQKCSSHSNKRDNKKTVGDVIYLHLLLKQKLKKKNTKQNKTNKTKTRSVEQSFTFFFLLICFFINLGHSNFAKLILNLQDSALKSTVKVNYREISPLNLHMHTRDSIETLPINIFSEIQTFTLPLQLLKNSFKNFLVTNETIITTRKCTPFDLMTLVFFF